MYAPTAARRSPVAEHTSDGSSLEQASIYWFAGAGLEKLSPDALTEHSIGAAAFEALKNSPDADRIVVTRVVAEGHGLDKVGSNRVTFHRNECRGTRA